jgi:HAD superfamily hydrolase (TIGR01490 family)
VLCGAFFGLHFRNLGRVRPPPAPLEELAERALLSFRLDVDPAIRQVLHEARESELFCPFLGMDAKENSLHLPGDKNIEMLFHGLGKLYQRGQDSFPTCNTACYDKEVKRRVKSRKVGVFDIDGTVFRSSLLRELLENLISAGVFPKRARDYYAHAYINWLDRRGSYEKYLSGIVSAYERYIKGTQQHIVWDMAHHVMDFHQNRVYKYTRDLMRDLKKSGYYLLAISGSPFDIVDPFARNMGFDSVYGRLFEVEKNERFTGRILEKSIMARKDRVLKRIIRSEHLTLKDSVGVGDSDSDIPFLNMVDRPIAFNPNIKLFNHAKKKGWEIVVERKDMIYEA